MKYTININQKAISTCCPTLDIKDAAILSYIIDFTHSAKMKRIEAEDGTYYWISYEHLLNEMPLLKIKSTDGIYRRLQKLVFYKIIRPHNQNKAKRQTYYRFDVGYDILISDTGKKQVKTTTIRPDETPNAQKRSDETPNDDRMKHRTQPITIGQKTDERSDETPIEHYTIEHSIIYNSTNEQNVDSLKDNLKINKERIFKIERDYTLEKNEVFVALEKFCSEKDFADAKWKSQNDFEMNFYHWLKSQNLERFKSAKNKRTGIYTNLEYYNLLKNQATIKTFRNGKEELLLDENGIVQYGNAPKKEKDITPMNPKTKNLLSGIGN